MTPYPVPLHAAGLVEWDAALERGETPPCRALETREMAGRRNEYAIMSYWHGRWAWFQARTEARMGAIMRAALEERGDVPEAPLLPRIRSYRDWLDDQASWHEFRIPLMAEPSTIAIPVTITEDDP